MKLSFVAFDPTDPSVVRPIVARTEFLFSPSVVVGHAHHCTLAASDAELTSEGRREGGTGEKCGGGRSTERARPRGLGQADKTVVLDRCSPCNHAHATFTGINLDIPLCTYCDIFEKLRAEGTLNRGGEHKGGQHERYRSYASLVKNKWMWMSHTWPSGSSVKFEGVAASLLRVRRTLMCR